MSINVIDVTNEDFEEVVLNETLPVIVDFWEPSCGSCVALAPMFEALAKEFKDEVKFVKVNTEDCPEIAEEYEISGLPTFMIFKDGEYVEEFEGDELPKKSDLREMIARNIEESEEESEDEEEEEDSEEEIEEESPRGQRSKRTKK
ncbi:MAG TPA: thioredoxin domain-containing protein [Leptospiraceae bacterium]|nr:thioredoxin domain-containing protein [Leptospiraceae bacterium]HRG76182.1 thioredoxin domain-containing protein [Leptospiraceae bacterium]